VTFSIVARSAGGAQFGVAVASKFLAAGAVVPAAAAGVGALATQANANLRYRPDGIALLRAGAAAHEAVEQLTAADGERAHRQLGVVAAAGPGANYTGAECFDWAGGVTGDGYAIQGNILTGPELVTAMERAWLAGTGVSGVDTAAIGTGFPQRLVAALAAGDEAGGDRRGRQSAALLVVEAGGGYGGGSDVLIDLRVDDHPDPVRELARLLELHELYFGRPDPAALLDLDGELAGEVAGRLAMLGHPGPDLATALADWAGVENLEERLVPGKIDPVVLTQLRTTSATGSN
jgi:uncharacterized Ntn-hydrolase superfamily protein